MRVALISRLELAVSGFSAVLRGLGHEVVGVVTTAMEGDRYGTDTLGAIAEQAANGFDVLVAGESKRFAPLLAALDADLALSTAFPLKIPVDALSVPRLGVVNTHPSLLPRYRGPNPIGWTLRNGDPELGFTIHRMDADFDTGPLLAQGARPIADADQADDVFAAMFDLIASLLPEALARVAAGDPGDPQPSDGASYAGFFEPEYAEIDWSRTAAEVQRQVLAWGVAATRPDARGAVTTIDGERVRVHRTRPDDAEGGTRMACADAPLWVVETEPAS